MQGLPERGLQTEEIGLRWVGGVYVCVAWRVCERTSFYMEKKGKWKMLAEVKTGGMDRQ